MTLVEEMFDKYHTDGNDALKKNIIEALSEIKDAMKQGKYECDLYLDWTDLPDDWVVLPNTVNYLREHGFDVEDKLHERYYSPSIRYVTVKWSKNENTGAN